MKDILFGAVVASLLLSNGLLVLSLARPHARFWPPPDPASWRYHFTRVNRLLGPLTVLGVFALGPLDWESTVLFSSGRFILGGVLFLLGGGFALWGYLGLGVRASQGRNQGLMVSGAYRLSRNPQYVGTIACLLGYAVFCGSGLALVAWALWSTWFLMAPFAEEPWLREQLGASYDEYAAIVPRFIGRRRGHLRGAA